MQLYSIHIRIHTHPTYKDLNTQTWKATVIWYAYKKILKVPTKSIYFY